MTDSVQVVDNPPVPGWTTEAKVTRIIDADTIEVEIVRKFAVRLNHPNEDNLIFDTPEKNTSIGQKASQFVTNIIRYFNGNVRLFIPSGQNESLMDFNSFSRIIGEIWLDKVRLTDILIKSGYGRLVKRDKRTSTPWNINE